MCLSSVRGHRAISVVLISMLILWQFFCFHITIILFVYLQQIKHSTNASGFTNKKSSVFLANFPPNSTICFNNYSWEQTTLFFFSLCHENLLEHHGQSNLVNSRIQYQLIDVASKKLRPLLPFIWMLEIIKCLCVFSLQLTLFPRSIAIIFWWNQYARWMNFPKVWTTDVCNTISSMFVFCLVIPIIYWLCIIFFLKIRTFSSVNVAKEKQTIRCIEETYPKAILPIALFMFWTIESIYAKRSNGT